MTHTTHMARDTPDMTPAENVCRDARMPYERRQNTHDT